MTDNTQPNHIVDMHEMVTDTNQASEDGLLAQICKIFNVFPEELEYNLPGGIGTDKANELLTLIRTEKLKLLAEVRERVIGEVPSKMNTDNWKYDRRVAELKLWQHQAIDNKIKALEEL